MTDPSDPPAPADDPSGDHEAGAPPPPPPPPPPPFDRPPPPPPPSSAWPGSPGPTDRPGPRPPVVGWTLPADSGRPTIAIGSIIGRSFDTFGREWSLFLVLAAPAALGALVQSLIIGSPSASPLPARPGLADLAPYAAGSLVSALFALVSTVAIVVAADALWRGQAIGVAQAFGGGLRALPRFLGVVLTIGLAIGGVAAIVVALLAIAAMALGPGAIALGALGLLVALPVGLYVSARLTFLAPVAILERSGVTGSILRAWSLSSGLALLLFLLSLAIGLCAALPLWGGTLFSSVENDPAVGGLALALATLVYQPLPAIAGVIAWGDRVGGRHADSAVMARGAGRRTAALLVFGLGTILFVAGFGLASQAAAPLP